MLKFLAATGLSALLLPWTAYAEGPEGGLRTFRDPSNVARSVTPVSAGMTSDREMRNNLIDELPSPEEKPLSAAERSFILNEQAVKLVLRGDRSKGEAYLDEALKNDPANALAMYNLAGLYLTDGRTSKAVSVMERAVSIEPKDPSYVNRLAEAHFANNDVSAAVEAYERLIAIDPGYEQVLLRLGTLYGAQGELEQAEELLQKAHQRYGDDIRVLNNLGTVLVARGNFRDAYPILLKAHKISVCPENAKGLGISSEALGKNEEAIMYYQEALKLGSADPAIEKRIERLQAKLEK